MSRKKLLRDQNSFGGRFSAAREEKGYIIKELAQTIGCSPGYISGIELNKKTPSEYFLNNLEIKTGINKDFLKSNKEPILIPITNFPEYNEREEMEGSLLSRDREREHKPKRPDVVDMVKTILKSQTEYAAALAVNVQAFYNAIQDRADIVDLKKDLLSLKKQVRNMEEQLAREHSRLAKHLEKGIKR